MLHDAGNGPQKLGGITVLGEKGIKNYKDGRSVGGPELRVVAFDPLEDIDNLIIVVFVFEACELDSEGEGMGVELGLDDRIFQGRLQHGDAHVFPFASCSPFGAVE